MIDVGTELIETDRLILRRLKSDDYVNMYNNWCNDYDVTKHVTWNVHKNMDETKEILDMWINEYNEPYCFRWVVELKETHEIFGTINVVKLSLSNKRCEIGYCYGKKWWGMGYATEALKAIIEYLFMRANAELIVIEHAISNPASGRVMEKAGLTYSGILPKWFINKDGIREDLKLYTILKSDYERNK